MVREARPACRRCGSPVGLYTDTSDGCPNCRGESLHFDGVFRLSAYEGTLRDAILRIKGAGGEALACALGRLLFQQLGSQLSLLSVDAVTPIPLHWLRRLRRGYNQARAIAEGIVSGLARPLHYNWLWRAKYTPRQATLTASERRSSPRGAFRARLPKGLRSKGVLLVDDVLTTGSTASAAAKSLKDAGVQNVWVVVLAKSDS